MVKWRHGGENVLSKLMELKLNLKVLKLLYGHAIKCQSLKSALHSGHADPILKPRVLGMYDYKGHTCCSRSIFMGGVCFLLSFLNFTQTSMWDRIV